MARSKSSNQANRTRRGARRWILFLLACLPLVILHLGMLVERVIHQETIDPFIAFRWTLAAVLLVLAQRAGFGLSALRSPTLGIAAILIFSVIHAPTTAPDPGLPLAVTGLGLALSLAVVDRRCGVLSLGLHGYTLARPASSSVGPGTTRETLRDRAPPVSR